MKNPSQNEGKNQKKLEATSGFEPLYEVLQTSA